MGVARTGRGVEVTSQGGSRLGHKAWGAGARAWDSWDTALGQSGLAGCDGKGSGVPGGEKRTGQGAAVVVAK